MKFYAKHLVRGPDFTEYEHGTRFMKFVVKDEKVNDSIEVDGAMFPKIEIHGFLSDSGELIITDEIVTPRQHEKGNAK